MAGKTIYISSTYEDLSEYREAAVKTIEDFGHQPKDSYSAGPTPVIDSCLKDVDQCDALVGIVAWRLGWRPTDGDPRTITEREFDRAEGKPRLIFLRDDSKIDLAQGIKDFRQKFQTKVRPAIFTDCDSFAFQLRKALKENFGGKPDDTPLYTLPYFCDRREQYEKIDDLLMDRKTRNATELMLLVVHGDQYQGGSRFMDVLESKFAEFSATKNLPKPEIYHLTWPKTFKDAKDFREQLQKSVAGAVTKDRHASRQAVEHVLTTTAGPIVIEAYLPTSEWQNTGEKAAREFFAFWDEWTDIMRAYPVLVVLRVEYELAQGWANFRRRWSLDRTNRAIHSFCENPFRPQSSFFQVLKELHRVPRGEAVKWSQSEVVCKFIKTAPALEPTINLLYDRKFAKEPEGGPRMDPLAGELVQLLKAQV